MKKKVTMRQIAETLGVSVVTVSNALSDRTGVSDDLRDTILRTAGDMGYQYTKPAPQQATGDVLGIVIAERYLFRNEAFYLDLHNRLAQKIAQSGCFSAMEVLTAQAESSCTAPMLFQNEAVKGIILLGQTSEAYLSMMRGLGRPIVLLDFYTQSNCFDAIVADNFYNAYLLTNHLIEQGHTEIGYIGNIRVTSSILDRYLGYAKSMIENNLPLRDEWLLPDRNEKGILHPVVLPASMPTAFVCNCDEVAYNTIEQLRACGLGVPEDVSIVGFDNYIYARLSKPQITTVEFDTEAMTDACVSNMLKKIKNPRYTFGRKVVTGKIIFRDSVMPIGGENPEQPVEQPAVARH